MAHEATDCPSLDSADHDNDLTNENVVGFTGSVTKVAFAGPITALHFLTDRLLLAGHSPYLRAYWSPTGELLAMHEIARDTGERVHGVSVIPGLTDEIT